MKRIRRMSFQLTHREISVSITQTVAAGTPGYGANPSDAADQKEQAASVAPANCPDCGAPWLPDVTRVLSNFHLPLELLRAALLDRSVHSFWLSDGQFLICAQSFKTIAETRT